MNTLFFIIGYCLIGFGFSQGWRTIHQEDFNMKYKLPKSWEVDGFGGGFGYWNMDGSSVCDCAGTVNFGYERTLGMVVYPLDEQSDLAKRAYIWGYHFVSANNSSTYTTKTLSFTKTVSKWEKDDPADYDLETLGAEVWKFSLKSEHYGFIIYFWAEPTLLKDNEKIIYKILDSFVQIKK